MGNFYKFKGNNTLISGCEFISNHVLEDDYCGGAISTHTEYAVIENSKFINNSVSWVDLLNISTIME